MNSLEGGGPKVPPSMREPVKRKPFEGNPEGQARYERLVVEHTSWLGRYVQGRVKNPSDTEDILQEVFIRVLRAMDDGRFNPDKKKPSSPDRPHPERGYLALAAKHVIIDEERKRSGKGKVKNPKEIFFGDEDEELFGTVVVKPSHDTGVDRREVLLNALQQLSPEQQKLLYLVYFADLSRPEIAKQLGAKEGTLKSRIFYANQRLREILAKEGITRRF